MSKRRFGKVMRRLGRKYDQESVITKKAGKPAHLHDTQSKKADKSFALGKSKPISFIFSSIDIICCSFSFYFYRILFFSQLK